MTIGIKVAVCRVVVRKQGYSHWGGGGLAKSEPPLWELRTLSCVIRHVDEQGISY